MKYENNGKTYEVESIAYGGATINVNGTTITDYEKMKNILGFGSGSGYSVFCDSDEVYFETFDEAYDFAVNKQKDTFRVEEGL